MNSQLYTAASGMIVERQRLDLIANNLANTSTTAYRAQRLFSVPSGGGAATPPGSAVAGTYDVPSTGARRETGRPLDIALENGEFLAIETATGRRYVRGGSLQLRADGNLTDGDGNPVLDSLHKPIQGLGATAEITNDGRVMDRGGELARLAVVRDPSQVLRRAGQLLHGERSGCSSEQGRRTDRQLGKARAIRHRRARGARAPHRIPAGLRKLPEARFDDHE